MDKNVYHNNINNNTKIDNKEIYSEVLDFFNRICEKNYTATEATKKLINARLRDGFSVENFKTVIKTKSDQWKGTDMDKFLRPQTLFSTKFEGYLNEKTNNNNSRMGGFAMQ